MWQWLRVRVTSRSFLFLFHSSPSSAPTYHTYPTDPTATTIPHWMLSTLLCVEFAIFILHLTLHNNAIPSVFTTDG
ncbi:uncharacterized protein BO97DRAFT_43848 [Aspergillus homomorphus CBS 101889]|uniref:Uncharacterized protein n=1 Tax=Aspergillus homomorphus (strain CBS 101889) TaxID=1450537 RepID=A0A395HZI0_ASPHC|nr:hypothetical protein BO97DRAFT_43848 [Aspergillus homomorphus CBS 101889]RAL13107.1 hypothetical protein BO97DRAFT_43848 [Aspergillus homomorphus CBS 101889]